jgi:hypothetical protein
MDVHFYAKPATGNGIKNPATSNISTEHLNKKKPPRGGGQLI